MKKAFYMLVSIILALGMASVATAVPFQLNDIGHDQGPGKLVRLSGLDFNEVAFQSEGGLNGVSGTRLGGTFAAEPILGQPTPLILTPSAVPTVPAIPEGGRSVALLGIAFITLVLLRRGWRQLCS